MSEPQKNTPQNRYYHRQKEAMERLKEMDVHRRMKITANADDCTVYIEGSSGENLKRCSVLNESARQALMDDHRCFSFPKEIIFAGIHGVAEIKCVWGEWPSLWVTDAFKAGIEAADDAFFNTPIRHFVITEAKEKREVRA